MKRLNRNPEPVHKLKRYLSFAATSFDTMGGWEDFRGDFDSKEEAESFLREYIINQCQDRGLSFDHGIWGYGWGQIFDTKTKQIVWTDS